EEYVPDIYWHAMWNKNGADVGLWVALDDCYFNGTIGGSLKVFVKKVPIGREDLQERVKKAYAHLDRLEAVGHPEISEEVQIIILRGYHQSSTSSSFLFTLHANIFPEHILLKFGDGGPYFRVNDDDVVIKFCGAGLSQKSRKEYKRERYGGEVSSPFIRGSSPFARHHSSPFAHSSLKWCMTRSSTKELLSPLENPERVLRSRRKLFDNPSLVETSSPESEKLSEIEEHIDEEVTETMAETIKQYMSKTR
ncbi:hypothetical protein Tco_0845216, partial [Tanacetum coccineum]